MPYCIECGVKLRDDVEYCPLCNIEVEHPDKKRILPPAFPEEIYEHTFFPVVMNNKNRIIFTAILFLSSILFFLLAGIDYIIHRDLTWSKYTSASILLVLSSVLIIAIPGLKNFFKFYLMNIAICLFLLFIDYIQLGVSWFISYALPSIVLFQFLSIMAYLFCLKIESPFIRSGIVAFLLSIFLNILDFIIVGSKSFSLITSSVLLIAVIYLSIVNLILRRRV
jgi:hypothetical protein